jgi:hypothetical protein
MIIQGISENLRKTLQFLLAPLQAIGESANQFYENYICRPGAQARPIDVSTTEDYLLEIPGDWFSIKDMDPPQEFIEVKIQPGGQIIRWYRGDTKIVSFQSITFLKASVAFSCTLIFGKGIPDRTCCFETREAPERLTIQQGVYVNASAAGVVLLAPNTEGKRISVIVQNQGTDPTPANDDVWFTPGAVGFRLAQGRDATFVGVPANSEFRVYSAGAFTPPIHATFVERL